jgi:acetyl-CoA carboxylase biotin carboxyl carrier protein
MIMDIRKVKKLIELLEESNIDEIEIKEGEESVRISRNSGAIAAPFAYAAPPAPMPAPVAAPAAAAPVTEAAAEPTMSGHQVKSPMVGTF